MVIEESSGRQFRFGMPGQALRTSEWKACLDWIESNRDIEYLVASGSLPPGVPHDFYAQIARSAARRGIRFVLDTRGEPLKLAVREGVFLLKPNLRELGQLAGTEIESEEQQLNIAEEILRSGGCKVLVLSLGAAGVLLMTPDTYSRIRSPSVPIKSKVGAGDSMVGGIVFGLAQGMDVRNAVAHGVAAGAAAVMTPGTSLCRKEDTQHLFNTLRDTTSDSGSERLQEVSK